MLFIFSSRFNFICNIIRTEYQPTIR